MQARGPTVSYLELGAPYGFDGLIRGTHVLVADFPEVDFHGCSLRFKMIRYMSSTVITLFSYLPSVHGFLIVCRPRKMPEEVAVVQLNVLAIGDVVAARRDLALYACRERFERCLGAVGAVDLRRRQRRGGEEAQPHRCRVASAAAQL